MPNQYTSVTPVQRFWSKIDKSGDCWLWIGSVNSAGYPRIQIGETMIYGHRFSWELAYGPIPEGMMVCHHCDTPRCVNPSHLFLGTAADNARDMAAKGRVRWGKGNTVLTEDQARAIRMSTESYRALAEQYGVSLGTIGHIKMGRTWKNLK